MKKAINNLTASLLSLFRASGSLANRSTVVAALLCLLIPSLPVWAETIEAKLPGGITASANFHTGNPSQPAVLIMHGFLQTANSPPASLLADNLASRGYTVLSPTSTLGINKRVQSMSCEAVHTQTIEEEVAEFAYWLSWLSNKGYTKIVPVGFSSNGNHQILLYNAQRHHPSIRKAILISLNPIVNDSAKQYTNQSVIDAKRHPNGKYIGKYYLGYCKGSYAATAQSFLSYANYDDNKILDLLKKSSVTTEVIIGADDTVLPANWPSRISALKVKVKVIDKADHFFDGAAEFDLADEVENVLKNIPAQ